MRIHYISDIHLEFMRPNHYENFRNRWRPDIKQADVLVLAGDIGNPRQPLYREFLQHCSQNCKKVFLIAGNHEFYGTTLWSCIENPLFTINDTEQIRDMSIVRYKELHTESLGFLDKTLGEAKGLGKQCVVITHHMPLYELIHEKYREAQMEPYNQWFASRLNSLVEKYASCVKGWVYGHTHTGSVAKFYDVTFYCNPVGYPGERPKLAYGAEFTV
jgi:predicted phosphodiesterase